MHMVFPVPNLLVRSWIVVREYLLSGLLMFDFKNLVDCLSTLYGNLVIAARSCVQADDSTPCMTN